MPKQLKKSLFAAIKKKQMPKQLRFLGFQIHLGPRFNLHQKLVLSEVVLPR